MQPAIRLPEIYDLNFKTTLDLPGVNKNAGGQEAAWGAAGAVLFYPFDVKRAFTPIRVVVENGSIINGNTTVAVYDEDIKDILMSTAATAQTGADARQYINITTSVLLREGRYYKALSNSGATGRYSGFASFRSVYSGVRQASSGGIVASPTIVDPASGVYDISIIPAMTLFGYAAGGA